MKTRNLLSGPVTLSSAKDRTANILHKLQYPAKREAFFQRLDSHHALLYEVVAHHFGVSLSEVEIFDRQYWLHGSFNLIIPVRIKNAAKLAVPEHSLLRFPLPWRVGEETNPGNSDEKISCEAATYAWIQDNCPSVPIPRLYGFGLSTNRRFTNLDLLPWWRHWFYHIQRFGRCIFGLEQLSRYICHNDENRFTKLDIGYLLIEAVVNGEMLSETWKEKRDNNQLRHNLQSSLAKIMVSLASIPLPRVGSFRFHPNGSIQLDNRPLNIMFTMHENEGFPLNLPRDRTFNCRDDYVLYHITAMDNRLLHQPNAIDDESDAQYQMTSLAAARMLFPQLCRKDLNQGPFALMLTDFHASNIIVDDDWNITSVIDLEFACSLPIEFFRTPYFLSGLIDEIKTEEFQPVHDEFVRHVENEEKLQGLVNDQELLSALMQRAWTEGAFWVTLAIENATAFTDIFYNRILADYLSITKEKQEALDWSFFAYFWRHNMLSIIEAKLKDRERYLKRLKLAFAD